MKLDLRNDFAEIYSHVAECIRRFDPEKNDGPGDGGPVSWVELGFEYSQSAWVCVVFDTRPDAKPDGEWNFHIDAHKLERPLWLEAGEALIENSITLVLPDGSEQVLEPGFELAESLGELLKSVILKARTDGLFGHLRRAAECEIGVEHLCGAYGWPAYEDRKKENLA